MIRFDVTDPTVRAKISLALKGNKNRLGKIAWNKGKKMSPQFCEKISATLRGKTGAAARRWQGGIKKFRPFKTRFKVLLRDNFMCQYCGRRSEEVPLEIDHRFPKAHGGKNTIDNYITACRDCNQGKGDIILGQTYIQNQ